MPQPFAFYKPTTIREGGLEPTFCGSFQSEVNPISYPRPSAEVLRRGKCTQTQKIKLWAILPNCTIPPRYLIAPQSKGLVGIEPTTCGF